MTESRTGGLPVSACEPGQLLPLGSTGALGPAKLNVVITSPFVWPWVRRGSERMVHEFSRYLTLKGHSVTVFSSGPVQRTEDRDGIAYHLSANLFDTKFRQFNTSHYFAFKLQSAIAKTTPDIVFCMNYFDAYAVLRARRRSGSSYRVVFQSAGMLKRRHFWAAPLDAWFFRTVCLQADHTLAVSRAAAEVYRHEFNVTPSVLAPPVWIDTGPARMVENPNPFPGAPYILFASDADDRRKGASLLCKALPHVLARFPEVRLVFAGPASPQVRQALVAASGSADNADKITFLGVGKVEDLHGLYQNAEVTVLPSVAESFGMVLVESLAAGTPVVGTQHGGIPEIINHAHIGQTFEPGQIKKGQAHNVQGLATAICKVLERGKTPETSAACKARAQQFSWDTLGPVYEALLQQAVAGDTMQTGHSSRPARPGAMHD